MIYTPLSDLFVSYGTSIHCLSSHPLAPLPVRKARLTNIFNFFDLPMPHPPGGGPLSPPPPLLQLPSPSTKSFSSSPSPPSVISLHSRPPTRLQNCNALAPGHSSPDNFCAAAASAAGPFPKTVLKPLTQTFFAVAAATLLPLGDALWSTCFTRFPSQPQPQFQTLHASTRYIHIYIYM